MVVETATASESRVKPRLTLSAEDYERLSALASAVRARLPERAAELANEIARAEVLSAGQHPEDVVCMNGEVEFRDNGTGTTRKVTLVYPQDADISQGRISVLTPVGTALIGLHAGDSMSWETPAGETRQLTVLAVR